MRHAAVGQSPTLPERAMPLQHNKFATLNRPSAMCVVGPKVTRTDTEATKRVLDIDGYK